MRYSPLQHGTATGAAAHVFGIVALSILSASAWLDPSLHQKRE
jgi:hypothetical protein